MKDKYSYIEEVFTLIKVKYSDKDLISDKIKIFKIPFNEKYEESVNISIKHINISLYSEYKNGNINRFSVSLNHKRSYSEIGDSYFYEWNDDEEKLLSTFNIATKICKAVNSLNKVFDNIDKKLKSICKDEDKLRKILPELSDYDLANIREYYFE